MDAGHRSHAFIVVGDGVAAADDAGIEAEEGWEERDGDEERALPPAHQGLWRGERNPSYRGLAEIASQQWESLEGRRGPLTG